MSSSDSRATKVERVAEKYNLNSIGQDLAEQWTRDKNRKSLRDLEDYFNKKVLQASLETVDYEVLDGELDNLFRLLTGDVSSGTRVSVERKLEKEGVDVEGLRKDFVTYQAIRTHLMSTENVEYERDTRNQVEKTRERLNRLQGRTKTVSETELDQLRNSGNVEIGDFSVFVESYVYCDDCKTRISINDFLSQKSCECDTDDLMSQS
ncbi:rod-determining factor RdfA [Natrarchaeobaculum aegyptiacum]